MDPFKGDLLDRKEKIEVLTRLVGNVEGPCTMAVDAAWGAGKTTFLKMWARHLCQQGFPVVEFNAWETDFTDAPFVALSSEITEGLSDWRVRPIRHKVAKAKQVAKDVARWVGPGGIRFATGFIPVVGTELGKVGSAYAEKRLADYPQATRTIGRFKSELEELAAALWEQTEHKPLVVFIDELDRCRPSYAIELLETGKHLFGVGHIVFVLAVNRAELAHSVRVLYGDRFGAEEYLRRFFDADYVLPSPDRTDLIINLMRQTGIEAKLEASQNQLGIRYVQSLPSVLTTFWGTEEVSLRTVGQSMHRLALVLATITDEEQYLIPPIVVLTLINAAAPGLYRRFIAGTMSGQKMVDDFFILPGYEDLRWIEAGDFVQAVLMAAELDINLTNASTEKLPEEPSLYRRYRTFTDALPGESKEELDEYNTGIVVAMAEDLFSIWNRHELPVGWKNAIDRTELFADHGT